MRLETAQSNMGGCLKKFCTSNEQSAEEEENAVRNQEEGETATGAVGEGMVVARL